jgi:hypothetical protein
MPMTDLSQFREHDRKRREARQFLARGANKELFVNDSLCNGNLTERAFALYYLGHFLSHGGAIRSDQATIESAIEVLEKIIKQQQGDIPDPAKTVQGNSDISKLPNSYATAVSVAGYLRGVKLAGAHDNRQNNDKSADGQPVAEDRAKNHLKEEMREAIKAAIDWLARQIQPNGFVPNLNIDKKPTPSAYLTFWCAVALREWHQYAEGPVAPEDKQSLRRLAIWSGRRLREMLAFHHGGLRPQFDVIETVYASATVLLVGEDPSDRVLIQHALSVLLEFYFKDGCLEASAPVFADVTGLIVQISTAEVLATIFLADSAGPAAAHPGSILAPHLESIGSAYEWLRNNGDPVKGWYPEGQARANVRNAYITVSAMLVIAEYTKLLDDRLDRDARAELGVVPFVPDPKLDQEVKYPPELGKLLQQTIISPIKNSQRKIASYSMVLYGPPGTSKTTIAKKVSQSLRWPLLKLDAGAFTREGRAGIDQEAAKTFELLKYVKNIVVLFDEFEELVASRESPQADVESRLLTTAMLPRLQDLRDRQEIVFILATNRVESIDAAITRLGRVDIVRCVLPPEAPEQKTILDALIREYNLSDQVKGFISSVRVAEESKNFCYGDLQALVREIAIAQSDGPCTEESVRKMFKHAQSKAISDDALKRYKESSEKYDRPGQRT